MSESRSVRSDGPREAETLATLILSLVLVQRNDVAFIYFKF